MQLIINKSFFRQSRFYLSKVLFIIHLLLSKKTFVVCTLFGERSPPDTPPDNSPSQLGQFPVPLITQLGNYIYRPTYMYAYIYTYVHIHIDACTHVYTHTIHTCIHRPTYNTYIHIFMHTYTLKYSHIY